MTNQSARRISLEADEREGVHDLIAYLSPQTFASPNRSTLPLVDFWRDADSGLEQLARRLDLSLAQPVELAFEYPVAVRRGRGKPSYTDLMVVAAETAVAIEAKYAEPEYENVAAWLRTPVEANRSEVLEGWLEMIEEVTGTTLDIDAVADLPYQLIHRTASVCAVRGAKRAVVYQLFGNVSPHYQQAMDRLSAQLGNTQAIRLHVWPCKATPTSEHASLEQRWKAKDPTVGAAVRAAMLAGPLFAFQSA